MKKIFALFALLLCFVQFSQAGDKVTRDVNKLPVAAREMINKHFPQAKVEYIKIEKDLFLSTVGFEISAVPMLPESDLLYLYLYSKVEWLITVRKL